MIDPMIWFNGKNAKPRFYLALIILFVGAVVDNVIVGFVIFTVVIVFIADIAYPFPNASFTWVLT